VSDDFVVSFVSDTCLRFTVPRCCDMVDNNNGWMDGWMDGWMVGFNHENRFETSLKLF
jgi:hypothetical protein